jgi:hypothetical protein
MKSIALALALLAATPALADEIWSTQYGQIIYETDRDGYIGVLSIPAQVMNLDAPADARLTVHVLGLAGNVTDRYGMFEGYWTGGTAANCEPAIIGDNGKRTSDWGRIELYFDKPDFPSGFTMILGACFFDPYLAVRAEPWME